MNFHFDIENFQLKFITDYKFVGSQTWNIIRIRGNFHLFLFAHLQTLHEKFSKSVFFIKNSFVTRIFNKKPNYPTINQSSMLKITEKRPNIQKGYSNEIKTLILNSLMNILFLK